jgi:nucleoid-associated protein YgaU
LLDYRRADGARLTLYQDGLVQAQGVNTPVISDTIAAGEAISLTTNLIEDEVVQPGLTSFGPAEAAGEGTVAAPRSRLLVRGPGGVYDAAWRGGNTAVAPVEELLAALLPEAITPELTPTVAPTGTVTITSTVVP